MTGVLDFILHLDHHIGDLFQHFGMVAYLILFAIVFAETGFVILPFLPGDTLLFLVGALAASNPAVHLWLAIVTFVLAAITGDSLNFEIGRRLAPRLFREDGTIPFLNPENLKRTEAFFQKHGGKAVVIGRFVPVIRTLVPFVAGTSKMEYSHFLRNNILGAVLWVSLFLFGGYWFGNIAFIKTHFALVIVAIGILSLIPVAYEYFRYKRSSGKDNNDKSGTDKSAVDRAIVRG